MTKTEKITFIQNITSSVAAELIDKVESGAVPEDWDGHELRQLLADKFAHEVSSLMRETRSKRVKAYRSTVIVNNL